jgi:hypothetical protein
MHRKRCVLVVLMMVSSVVAACSTAPPDDAAVTPEVADIEATPPAEDVSEPEPAEDDAAGPFGDARDDGGSDARDDAPEEAADAPGGGDDAGEAADGTDRGDNDASDADAGDGSHTADGDPYAIPEDGIDEAYVERVLNALFEVNREALQLTLDSEPGGLAPLEAEEMIRSIYEPPYASIALQSLNQLSASSEGRGVFREPPGPVVGEVVQIEQLSEECIIAEATTDFEQVLLDAPEARTNYYAMQHQGSTEHYEASPIGWKIVDASISSAAELEC